MGRDATPPRGIPKLRTQDFLETALPTLGMTVLSRRRDLNATPPRIRRVMRPFDSRILSYCALQQLEAVTAYYAL